MLSLIHWVYVYFACVVRDGCNTAAVRLLHLFTQSLPSIIINKYDDVVREREREETEGKIETPFTCIVSSPHVCGIFYR